jgi:hypothetical protein
LQKDVISVSKIERQISEIACVFLSQLNTIPISLPNKLRNKEIHEMKAILEDEKNYIINELNKSLSRAVNESSF